MTLINARDVGLMTLDRWLAFWCHIGARTILNGVDITHKCVWFYRNEAECLVLDKHGHARADRFGNAEVELLTGRLEVAIP